MLHYLIVTVYNVVFTVMSGTAVLHLIDVDNDTFFL